MAKALPKRRPPQEGAAAGEIHQAIRKLAAKLPLTDDIRMAIDDLAPAPRNLGFAIAREKKPPRGAVPVNLGFRRRAAGGDAIRVVLKTRSGGKPIADAPIRLMTMMNDELAIATTNERGEAIFAAPSFKWTQTLQLALDAKWSRFLPPGHRICKASGFKHGFTPLDAIVVTPETPLVFEAGLTPVAGSTDFEIDQGFGWFMGTRGFSGLIERAEQKGWQADDDWWASRRDIYEHVEQKTCEDVWNFFGHSVKDESTGRIVGIAAWHKFNWARPSRVVTKQGLCQHIQKDGESPGIVFLGACQSADLLQDLVNCCVKVAIGFTAPLGFSEIAKVMIAFWEAMFNGASLQRTITHINRNLLSGLGNTPIDALANPNDAQLKFRAKPWIQSPGNKTLEQLLSLRAPGETH